MVVTLEDNVPMKKGLVQGHMARQVRDRVRLKQPKSGIIRFGISSMLVFLSNSSPPNPKRLRVAETSYSKPVKMMVFVTKPANIN